jgi:phosphoribosylformylglycinamidine cyclo-ligase
VFSLVKRVGDVPQGDLEATLNQGVGMVALTPADDVDRTIAILADAGIPAWVAGSVGRAAEGDEGRVRLVGQHPGW